MINIKNVTCYITVEGEWQQASIIVKDANKALKTMIDVGTYTLYKLEDGSIYANIPSHLEHTAYDSDEYGWFFFDEDEENIRFEEWFLQHESELVWQTYVEDKSLVDALYKEEQEKQAAIKAKEEAEALRLKAIKDEADTKAALIAQAKEIMLDKDWYPQVWKDYQAIVDEHFSGAILCIDTPSSCKVTEKYGGSSGDGFADAFTSFSETYIKTFQKKVLKLKDGSVINKDTTFIVDSLEKAEAYINKLKLEVFNDYHFYKQYNQEYKYAVSVYTLDAWVKENYKDIILYNSENPKATEYIPWLYRMEHQCDNWAHSVANSLGVTFDSWKYTQGKYLASYKDEYGDNVYFYMPVDDAYNLNLIRQEIQSCLDKNRKAKEAEAKKKADIAARNKAEKERQAAVLAESLTKYAPYIEAAKKAGLTLIEEEGKLPKVKGIFFLRNYGGRKGANNPYINYIADDPNGFKYLKVAAKPVLKKKV